MFRELLKHITNKYKCICCAQKNNRIKIIEGLLETYVSVQMLCIYCAQKNNMTKKQIKKAYRPFPRRCRKHRSSIRDRRAVICRQIDRWEGNLCKQIRGKTKSSWEPHQGHPKPSVHDGNMILRGLQPCPPMLKSDSSRTAGDKGSRPP